jgi:crotonobetainyl-CoA:carnitine CoA-transferase CaiB-like acyl-CoA transferase
VSDADEPKPAGPLVGLRVVELAHLVAGPMAGSLMADLGADVVHVEAPGVGDPARRVGPAKGDVPLWWKVGARNKRSVTIDLRTPDGQALARRLATWADVVMTNFRPSTLESWGLDHPSLHLANPRLITLQVSAFGATGPGRAEPGFGKIGEAMSGATHLTGFPDGQPTLTGYLLSDAVAALMGVVAVEAALYRRAQDDGFDGEWIDIALFEPLFRMIDWQVLVHDQLGVVPGRAGNETMMAETALVDTVLTGDLDWIVVSCGTDRSLAGTATLVGGPLGHDRRRELTDVVAAWAAQRSTAECLEQLHAAGASVSRIFSVADIVADPVYAARGNITVVDDPELGPIHQPAVLPHMRVAPGRVWRAAPTLGQDNELVLGEYLHLDAAEIARLRGDGTI